MDPNPIGSKTVDQIWLQVRYVNSGQNCSASVRTFTVLNSKICYLKIGSFGKTISRTVNAPTSTPAAYCVIAIGAHKQLLPGYIYLAKISSGSTDYDDVIN